MSDRDIIGVARIGYTRIGVRIPIFEHLRAKLEQFLPRGSGRLDPDIIGMARIGYTRICVQIAMFESLRAKMESLTK